MTRKDFEAVAESIRLLLKANATHEPAFRAGVAATARAIADGFRRSNARFRYDKFYEACGLSEWGEVIA